MAALKLIGGYLVLGDISLNLREWTEQAGVVDVSGDLGFLEKIAGLAAGLPEPYSTEIMPHQQSRIE